MKTNKAIINCFKWIQYCISIGWSLDDVNGLEKLWWKYHDDYGNLINNN